MKEIIKQLEVKNEVFAAEIEKLIREGNRWRQEIEKKDKIMEHKIYEEKKNFVQMDYIKMNEIIERIFKNEYNDDSLKRLKYILNYSYKTSDSYKYSIELIKEYLLILIKDGILTKEPASEYLLTPIFRVYSDDYYLLRDVTNYMDLEDKNRFCAEVLKADPFIHDHLIRTGKITSFDRQAASELHECSALGDLELLRYLLHKTYDLNVKTANIDQFNSQWVIINSVISMLLERKVITTNRFSHIGIGISITVRNKNYFIDTCYLSQL